MIDLIKFCNDNGLISFIALFLSVISLLITFYNAKISFRKKLLLKLQILNILSNSKHVPVGYNVRVENIGNKGITLDYVGLAYKEKGETKQFVSKEEPIKHKMVLNTNESFYVPYSYDIRPQIINKRMFLIAQESSGKIHRLTHSKMCKTKEFITKGFCSPRDYFYTNKTRENNEQHPF